MLKKGSYEIIRTFNYLNILLLQVGIWQGADGTDGLPSLTVGTRENTPSELKGRWESNPRKALEIRSLNALENILNN